MVLHKNLKKSAFLGGSLENNELGLGGCQALGF